MDTNNKSEENEIEILELIKILWCKRKLILKVSLIGLIIGIIIASSIPRVYTSTVILAPEQQSQSSGNAGTLATLAGLNLSGTNSNTITPDLYPTIAQSTPFLIGLFDIIVKDCNNTIDTTLYVYLKDYQKSAWWSSIFGVPSKLLGLFRNQEISDSSLRLSKDECYIALSQEDEHILQMLKKSLNVNVDGKNGMIYLSLTMQDPQISAYITDTITKYLQEYVINYRTLKARQDLEFTQKLFDETKSDFYKKQQELANYTDANVGVISAKYATTRDRLQNEVNLAYSMYNQMAQEFQKTKIKVQDTTPVYTIIEPSVEPLMPSAPNKKTIVLVSVLLFALGGSIWVFSMSFYSKKQNRRG